MLNHMIGAAGMFAACARGESQPFPDWSVMPDWVGDDPAASYRRSAAALIAAYSAPGVLGGEVTMPWGAMPAAFALNVITADHVTHSWDLARTAGLPIVIDDETRRRRPRHDAGSRLRRVPRRRLLRPRTNRPRGRRHHGPPRRLHRPPTMKRPGSAHRRALLHRPVPARRTRTSHGARR